MERNLSLNNLYLDDIRVPYKSYELFGFHIYENDNWDIIRCHDDFVTYIETFYEEHKQLPNIISLDHDLADEHYSSDMYKGKEVYDKNYEKFTEKTGYDSIKFLVDFIMDKQISLKLIPIVVLSHSQNPVGKKNIEMYWKSFIKEYQII